MTAATSESVSIPGCAESSTRVGDLGGGGGAEKEDDSNLMDSVLNEFVAQKLQMIESEHIARAKAKKSLEKHLAGMSGKKHEDNSVTIRDKTETSKLRSSVSSDVVDNFEEERMSSEAAISKSKDNLNEDEDEEEHSEKRKKKSRHKSPKDKSSKKKHHRSRSRNRRRSRSRSTSYDRDHRVRGSASHTSRGHRSRSRDRYKRYRSKSREREHSRRYRSRSRERRKGNNRIWSKRSRSRSWDRRSRSPVDRDRIDKAKLRQIAIVNALNNMQCGQGPAVDIKSDQVAALKSGGYSVAQLTDFCKKIADKDKSRQNDNDDSPSERAASHDSSDNDDGPFINHPFKMREFQANIVMNIKNARQLSSAQLASRNSSGGLHMQFPVSSGNQHRANEWVPVETMTTTAGTSTTTTHSATTTGSVATTTSASSGTVATSAVHTTKSGAMPTAMAGATPSATPSAMPSAAPSATPSAAPIATSSATPSATPAAGVNDGVFGKVSQATFDISQVVSERLSAIRRLQSNPQDVQAMNTMSHVQQQVDSWAQSGSQPGRFTGVKEVLKLSNKQLHAGPQAWAKKDQFARAAPVQGGIGMQLLQRMGWKKGEGLGRNNEGSLEPIMLDVKMDRKGLSSMGESSKRMINTPATTADLSGKHPISALVELCSKQKWGAPNFIAVHETGPDHQKNFLFKVVVNGQEYQSSVHSPNKKQAKAMSATVCLQQLGLIP